jgi:hypothetical protein
MGVEAQQVAQAHRLLEDELVHRHGGDAALGDAAGQHGAGQVHLGHDPAAEDVAVGVDVGRQRHHAQHQFGAVGQAAGSHHGVGQGGRSGMGKTSRGAAKRGAGDNAGMPFNVPAAPLPPMRNHALRARPVAGTRLGPRSDWNTLARLLPYLWRYRWRVGTALAFLVAAKVANVGVPVLSRTWSTPCPSSRATRPRCWSCRWAWWWPMARCG